MKFTIFAIPATLALLGGAAMAETTVSGDTVVLYGQTWSGTVGNRFFTDEGLTTLRVETEVRSAWDALAEADRVLILADCEVLKNSAQGDNKATGTETPSEEATTGETASALTISHENMTQLCAIVDPM